MVCWYSQVDRYGWDTPPVTLPFKLPGKFILPESSYRGITHVAVAWGLVEEGSWDGWVARDVGHGDATVCVCVSVLKKFIVKNWVTWLLRRRILRSMDWVACRRQMGDSCWGPFLKAWDPWEPIVQFLPKGQQSRGPGKASVSVKSQRREKADVSSSMVVRQ